MADPVLELFPPAAAVTGPVVVTRTVIVTVVVTVVLVGAVVVIVSGATWAGPAGLVEAGSVVMGVGPARFGGAHEVLLPHSRDEPVTAQAIAGQNICSGTHATTRQLPRMGRSHGFAAR